MTEITRDQKIAILADWGFPAKNSSLLSDEALDKRFRPFAQPEKLTDAEERLIAEMNRDLKNAVAFGKMLDKAFGEAGI